MKHYLQTGVYVSAFRELITVVDEEEKAILETQNPDAENDAFMLLGWASKTMKDINAVDAFSFGCAGKLHMAV